MEKQAVHEEMGRARAEFHRFLGARQLTLGHGGRSGAGR